PRDRDSRHVTRPVRKVKAWYSHPVPYQADGLVRPSRPGTRLRCVADRRAVFQWVTRSELDCPNRGQTADTGVWLATCSPAQPARLLSQSTAGLSATLAAALDPRSTPCPRWP